MAHLTLDPLVKGSRPATAVGTGREREEESHSKQYKNKNPACSGYTEQLMQRQ
jgi:hypothetical protein